MKCLVILGLILGAFSFEPAYAEKQTQIQNPQEQEILDYWFGPIKSAEDYPKEKMKLWFGKDPAVDKEIRDKYENLVISASKGELNSWKKTPRGRLALIILLDQFPRNIYRNAPKAFAFDALAQKITLEGLDSGDDLKLLPIERIFFYLPLEHAENLELQKLSVVKFQELLVQAPDSVKANYASALNYAERHAEIIEKFGRFPHRNQILDRKSTQEEIDFLKTPNSSF